MPYLLSCLKNKPSKTSVVFGIILDQGSQTRISAAGVRLLSYVRLVQLGELLSLVIVLDGNN